MNSERRETTSDLVLSDLSVGDSGVYTCRAVNEVEGEALGTQEAEATLEVISKSSDPYCIVSICSFSGPHMEYTFTLCAFTKLFRKKTTSES